MANTKSVLVFKTPAILFCCFLNQYSIAHMVIEYTENNRAMKRNTCTIIKVDISI